MKLKKEIISVVMLLLAITTSLSPSSSSTMEIGTPIRSISLVPTTAFGKNAFDSVNYFFMGAIDTDQNKYALSRAYLYTDTTEDPDKNYVKIKGLAPEEAYVNLVLTSTDNNTPAPTPEKVNNPIYDADINHLTLYKRNIVVALGTKNPQSIVGPTKTNQMVCKVTDAREGSYLTTNIVRINDAASVATSGITGIAASQSYVFVGVNPASSNDSGIAILKSHKETGSLIPVDATTGKDGNRAVSLLSNAGTNVTLNDHIAMHYDDVLGRVFVGLHISQSGGTSTAFGVLVGKVNGTTPKLTLVPATPSSVMTTNNHNYISSFVSTSGNHEVKIHQLKTMHTSTGLYYLIVNGNVYTTGNIDKRDVFAQPIVHKKYTDKSLDNADDTGRVTDNDNADHDALVSDQAKLARQTDAAAIVGQGQAPTDIEDIYITGASVYVLCAHATDQDKQGIFHSTAMFDSTGNIRSWTPWQRVMGATDPVYGMGTDPVTSNFWYITKTATAGDTIKSTHWIEQDVNLLGNLRDVVEENFPQDQAGVHQLFNFDEKTPGFKTDEFSMMVATGNQKVAVIRTGKPDAGLFVPTAGTDFSTSVNANFKVFTDEALQNIGPICAAEVARSSSADEGWLFVGGYGGLAVLRKGTDGNGWTDIEDLSFTDMTFKEIGDFSRVHKIVCDGTYLYVMTQKALYRIYMDSDKFKDTSPDPLDAQIIAQPTYTNLTTCDENDSFLDFVVSSKVGLLATTSGLYRTSNDKDVSDISVANARFWTEVKTVSDYSLGPVGQISYQSTTKGSFSTGGILYIIASNMSTGLSTIVRFDLADTSGSSISDTTIQQVTERVLKSTDTTKNSYYPFGEFRGPFVTNGNDGFHTLPTHFDRTNLARKIELSSIAIINRGRERVLSIAPGSSAYNAAAPVQNTASGAWIIPGDWGIRVNE